VFLVMKVALKEPSWTTGGEGEGGADLRPWAAARADPWGVLWGAGSAQTTADAWGPQRGFGSAAVSEAALVTSWASGWGT
jgi:hypothetical protein